MSRYAPLPFSHVKLEGQFWRERLETVLTRTVPSQHRKLAEYGILDSLKLPDPPPPLRFPRASNGFTVQVFWDSDVGKWIEAASYALSHRRDPDIENKIEAAIDDLEMAQAPDGYLNCWYLGREPENRWTNLRDNHEFYNAGHLLEGAIAYFQATGRRRFLDIMERYLDHIYSVFGRGDGQKRGYDGHEEIELALMKLYYLTGERRHLDFAAYLVDERGQQPHYFDMEREARAARGLVEQRYPFPNYEYSQSHKPVREQDKVVGHAVRAMYLYTAMADLAAELGDASLKRACEVLWNDVMNTKMYVTAGLGPSAHNEGFTHDYDLPNQTAYAETCASVALIFWAQRMLHLDLDGKYGDILELAMFNGALSGLSRDGEHYFYANPLESDGRPSRWEWHTCPCCTMNVSRLVASVSGYFLSTAADGVAFHLYGGISTEVEIGGTRVALREVSDYPWRGEVAIHVDPRSPAEFDVKLRIPGWCTGASVSVNGRSLDVAQAERGYLTVRRIWGPGDIIRLNLPMPPVRLYAHPAAIADAGRVALKRGPLVYCLEEVDNPGGRVQRLRLPRKAELHAEPYNIFDGAVALTADGVAVDESDFTQLYRTTPPTEQTAVVTAIPYFLWANRGQGTMVVWVPESAG
ncbi:glycoside hydrolase family 127 protein [Devosia albogilva]|uniref:Glycoside hydrolase family 127 protein n=1 Tax=Devosia albogilva TaxID=429726 RepID=A0ABW5QQA3_9HYPH